MPGAGYREMNKAILEKLASFEKDWEGDALCVGMDSVLFFPEQGQSARETKQICAACPVEERCLDFAIETGQSHGIWGGKTEPERRKIRRRRLKDSGQTT